MRPHLAASMSGSADCVQWNVPVRFTAMIRSHSSGADVDEPVEAVLAAPFTSTSTGPSSATRALDGVVDLRPVRDVDLARDRLAALVADVLRGALGLLEVEVEDRHLRAVTRPAAR